MQPKLIDRLAKAQEALRKGEINLLSLQKIQDEVAHAFDQAATSIVERMNLGEELERQKERLRHWRRGFWATVLPIELRVLVSVPFIYGAFVPTVIFHLGLEIYHQVCFRLYGIPRVSAREYFVFDRSLLPYLNWLEKFNCFYCSYFNNLMSYAAEIGGRTERYWCPIKYARRLNRTHTHYHKFVDYLDAQGFREKWGELRDFSDVVEAERRLHEETEAGRPGTDAKACDFRQE